MRPAAGFLVLSMGPLVSSEGPEVAARKLLVSAGRTWPSCSGQVTVQARVRFPPSCSLALHCFPGFGGNWGGWGYLGVHCLLASPAPSHSWCPVIGASEPRLALSCCSAVHGEGGEKGVGTVPWEGPGGPAATLGSPLLPLLALQQGQSFPDPSGCWEVGTRALLPSEAGSGPAASPALLSQCCCGW